MKKITVLLACFFMMLDCYAANVGRAGRNVSGGVNTYRSGAGDSGNFKSGAANTVAEIPSVVSVVENSQEEAVAVDLELEKINKNREICLANNIGINNTFVWAAKNSPADNYANMIEDVKNPKNNTCYVKVDVKSTDSRIDMSGIKSKYFEMGKNVVCGTWLDEKDLEKRILDGKKKARNWGIAASVVGGAGVGVGAMELFGNKLIGGKVMGQKALEGQDLLVSQIKALEKDNKTEYGRVIDAIKKLEESCADSIWNGNKPEDCGPENPFIGLMERLK